jgi:ankyrin repeat protein
MCWWPCSTPRLRWIHPTLIAERHCISPRRSPSTEATKLLVERGADWSARDEKGWTPLWFAVERGRIETLQLLLSTQVSMDAPDRDGKTLLRIAVQSGEVAKAQLMLEAKAGVNVGYGSPLHYAVCSGGKMVSLLLQHRANIEGVASEGSTALHHAASSGFLDAVVSLVSARANVNAVQRDGHTPLHCAVRSGRFGGDNAALIMRVLLDAGADVDAAPAGKRTPLVDAVMAGLPAETEVLLSNGAAVDQGDERDQVPLHWAAFYGRGEVVRILLRAGASLESMGGYSSSGGQLVYGTPLEQALFYGSLMGDYGAAITLLECGASLDLVTRLSENARHFVHHTLAERRKRCWDVIIVLIGLKRFRRTVMQSNHLDVVMLIARRLIWPTRRHGIWDEQGVHCPTLLRPTSC